jgi:hypothetical protein
MAILKISPISIPSPDRSENGIQFSDRLIF